jgi:deferrochelatase/peroxidase EfeB
VHTLLSVQTARKLCRPLDPSRHHESRSPLRAEPTTCDEERTQFLRNGGAKMLRQGYNFVDGSDSLGRMEAGLFFLAYVRDLRTQFIPSR